MLRQAKCQYCRGFFFVADMVSVPSPKRGGNDAHICPVCAKRNRGYHTANDAVCGTAKANKVKVGIEYESSFSDEQARLQFAEYDFIPTHDGSLESDGNGNRYGYDGNTCEYVSGLMQGLNQPSKFCVTAEKLMNEGHLKVNDSCGTHFHASINDMKDANGNQIYMGRIRRFYHTIFGALQKELLENPEDCKKFFGRNFTHYARQFTAESRPKYDRYLFINCTHNNRIEFRLNKFCKAKQYQELMKFEVEVIEIIITNFLEHFDEEPKDRRRYADIQAYRLHKAEVTANKIVRCYKKHLAKV